MNKSTYNEVSKLEMVFLVGYETIHEDGFLIPPQINYLLLFGYLISIPS